MTDQHISDDSDLRKYRTELPNLIDDLGLDVYEARLYLHYKRVCGAFGGECWESVRTTAERCDISVGKVSEIRRALETKGLIQCEENDFGTISVRIIDIWPMNFWWYSTYRDNTPPPIDSIHNIERMYQVFTTRTPCSPHEQQCSPGELKKEPYKKEPFKKKTASPEETDSLQVPPSPTPQDSRAAPPSPPPKSSASIKALPFLTQEDVEELEGAPESPRARVARSLAAYQERAQVPLAVRLVRRFCELARIDPVEGLEEETWAREIGRHLKAAKCSDEDRAFHCLQALWTDKKYEWYNPASPFEKNFGIYFRDALRRKDLARVQRERLVVVKSHSPLLEWGKEKGEDG